MCTPCEYLGHFPPGPHPDDISQDTVECAQAYNLSFLSGHLSAKDLRSYKDAPSSLFEQPSLAIQPDLVTDTLRQSNAAALRNQSIYISHA